MLLPYCPKRLFIVSFDRPWGRRPPLLDLRTCPTILGLLRRSGISRHSVLYEASLSTLARRREFLGGGKIVKLTFNLLCGLHADLLGDNYGRNALSSCSVELLTEFRRFI